MNTSNLMGSLSEANQTFGPFSVFSSIYINIFASNAVNSVDHVQEGTKFSLLPHTKLPCPTGIKNKAKLLLSLVCADKILTDKEMDLLSKNLSCLYNFFSDKRNAI